MGDLPISPLRVPLKKSDLTQMLGFLRASWKLSNNSLYQQRLASELPESARLVSGNAGVMMGYDFHLTEDGPRLIEINTNAGGAALALRACQGDTHLTPSLQRRLIMMFMREWHDFAGGSRPLRILVILDENPAEQALFAEMQQFSAWLASAGIVVHILDPAELVADERGLRYAGAQVDMIYNRHCDFYLDDSIMIDIRRAYLERKVCLTPNPFTYGHLADKRRMVLWCQTDEMSGFGLQDSEVQLLQKITPRSRLLGDLDSDQIWAERKNLVLKPVARYGSKGVLLGKGMSRKRYAELDPEHTLVQDLVPPSQIVDSEGNSFKVDLRLYAWRDRSLGVAARLYQGQVTNLQTVGGGFAAVTLV